MIEKYYEVICQACDTLFVIPKELHEEAMKDSKVPFFCPYGHKLCFDEESRRLELEDKLNEQNEPKKPNLRLVVNNEVE